MPGEKIPRSVSNLFGDANQYAIPENASGRLQLAGWIASRDNPLTSRVAVNRMWAWLIGQGIVDFRLTDTKGRIVWDLMAT